MVSIPVSTVNHYLVRIGDIESQASGLEMTHSQAAEVVALARWPKLRDKYEDIRLVERANDWMIYQLDFEGESKRVAVCKMTR